MNSTKIVHAIAAVAAALLLSSSALAAPGDVEPGFNPGASDSITAVALQPDGRVLIGGRFTTIAGQLRQRLARLEADGTLDPFFAPNVSVTGVSVIAVQADGRIVIGGAFSTVNGSPRLLIARLNPDGSLDPSFNPNVFPAVGLFDSVSALWIDAAGRVLLCGSFPPVAGGASANIARLLPDGTVDPSFNAGVGTDAIVRTMAVQDDGRIVIGGDFTTIAGQPRRCVARLNADGTLDPSFVTDFVPRATLDLPGVGIFSIAIQPNGRIVLGGWFDPNPGNPNPGFSNDNIAVLEASGAYVGKEFPALGRTPLGLVFQADGHLIVTGSFTAAGGGGAGNRLIRYQAITSDPDVERDLTFDPNANGVVTTALQADGRVVAAGDFTTIGGQPRQRLARVANDPAFETLTATSASRIQWWRNGAGPETVQVSFDLSTDYGATWTPLGPGTRIAGGWEKTGLALPQTGMLRARARTVSGYDNGSTGLVETIAEYAHASAGDLDLSFGNGGTVTTDFSGGTDIGYSVAVQQDGRILVAGMSRRLFSGEDFGLVRYTPAGELDASFGNGGIVTSLTSKGDGRGLSVAMQEDGKILVAGYSGGMFALARYWRTGVPDSSFGIGGKVTTDLSSNFASLGQSVAVQSDGKILVAGTDYSSGISDFALARFTATGILDASFGSSGKVITPIGSGSDQGKSVAVQSDGKILVVGDTSNGGQYDLALVRYTTTGALDTSFGTGGKVATDLGGYEAGRSVLLQSDGKILVAGSSALRRYLGTGVLDASFGSGGVVALPIGVGDSDRSVAVQRDGKILVAGNSGFSLVRYTTTGVPDASFGSDGRVTTLFGLARSVSVQRDGRIVVAGQFNNGSNSDFAAARYLGRAQVESGVAFFDPVPTADDGFGVAVAVSGSLVAIGSPRNDTGASNAGSVFLYDRASATPHAPVAILNHPSPAADDGFGSAVAISGSRVVVGARYRDAGATNAGAAYVFDLASATPTVPVASLNLPAPFANAEFGAAVAISGIRVLVGTFANGAGSTDSGIVYVYDVAGATPTAPVLTIQNPSPTSDGAYGERFGHALALDGRIAVVGSWGDDSVAASDSGAVYLYDLESATPTVAIQTIYNPTPAFAEGFGVAVAISGPRVVVGAMFESTALTASGAAYVYDLASPQPTVPVATLDNPSPAATAYFGGSVGISGGWVVVGAYGTDRPGTDDVGVAHVFNLDGLTPTTPMATLENPTPAALDRFGLAVAVDGKRVVVGAGGDDTQAADAGAAYTFAPPPADIVVDVPDEAALAHNVSTLDLGDAPIGSTTGATTIRVANYGGVNLTGLAVTKTGANPGDYVLDLAGMKTALHPDETTTFTIRFAPTTGTATSARTATIQIANTDPEESPFLFTVTANALSSATDTDGDGLNDATEFNLSSLGLDWQTAQPALVNTLFANLGGALPNLNASGYFTQSQVQALHADTPLLTRNGTTGEFTLTVGIKRSLDLMTYQNFPFINPQTVINAEGKIEFRFTTGDDAAFFRLETE